VFAANRLGAAVAAKDSGEALRSYKYYCIAHITIFGHPKGSPRHGKPALRRRAALAAADLRSQWLQLRELCGVRDGTLATARRDAATGLREADAAAAEAADPPTEAQSPTPPEDRLPARTSKLSHRERMLLAQHWINKGNVSRALGVFQPSTVGDGTDPALLLALLGLTPQRDLPSPEVMADKPGVSPLRLQPDTVKRVLSTLPTGRAKGTLLTSYELASATFAAGASAGWTAFYTAFAAGALPDTLIPAITALRAVKSGGDARPSKPSLSLSATTLTKSCRSHSHRLL
jgi:hypothetical protein